MKKISLLGILSISVLMLGSCGGNTTKEEKKETNIIKTEENTSESTENQQEESEDVINVNKEITDNENFKATLIDVKHIINTEYDEEKYIVSFDIENKRADTITVQARELSIDNRMVDESLITMSTDISGGKAGTAELTIEDYTGEELPEIKGNIEMLLHVFNEDIDAEEYNQDEQVNIEIN